MNKNRNSYSDTLKFSAIIGGSQLIVMLIGVIQTKCVAIFLGPAGVGLAGSLNSILNLTGRFVGLGLGGSGVRQIAAANSSGDSQSLYESLTVLRILVWFTGAVGFVLLWLIAEPVSQWTFETPEYAWAIRAIAIVILLRNIQAGQMAYIQGLRRINDLARLKIIGAIAGATVGVGLYAWLRIDGIVPVIIAMAVINLAASWYFARKATPKEKPKIELNRKVVSSNSQSLVSLGVVLMWSGLAGAIVAYLTRALIINEFDLDSAGIFQSAYKISGIFVGFILMAMGADFYPRLTEIADDNPAVNQLVNEQTEIGILLALPGLLITLAFAPFIIAILYTPKFAPAADLLNWFVLGCIGRVISWPLGFILLAKNCKAWLVTVETFIHVLHVGLIWIGLKSLGLIGVSVAFAVLYLFHILILVFVTRFVTGFRWTKEVQKLLLYFIPIGAAMFALTQLLGDVYVAIIGAPIAAASGFYSVSQVVRRLGPDHKLSRKITRLPILGRFIK